MKGVWVIYCDAGYEGIIGIDDKCYATEQVAQERVNKLNAELVFSGRAWEKEFIKLVKEGK